jgi:hypothetical protein
MSDSIDPPEIRGSSNPVFGKTIPTRSGRRERERRGDSQQIEYLASRIEKKQTLSGILSASIKLLSATTGDKNHLSNTYQTTFTA